MITLDKIKIVAPLNSIAVVDDNKFECKVRKGAVTSRSYTQVVPFQLYVEQDYEDKESILEFTGKILSDKYPDHINSENFDLCIDRINGMGFCLIDKNMIREYGRACVVDVTKDVPYPDVSGLSEWLRTNISNHRKFLARNIGGNLVIEKNVKTRVYKRRLTVYDKWRELLRVENKKFICSLQDSDALQSYFKGKIRFELNLNSMQAIRKTLNIQDTSIDEILNSDANPIYDFINDVIVEEIVATDAKLSWSERKNLAFLRDCCMDIAKVEAEIRKYASKGTHISQAIRPYKTLLSKLQNKGQDFKKTLLGLLLETIVLPLLLVW